MISRVSHHLRNIRFRIVQRVVRPLHLDRSRGLAKGQRRQIQILADLQGEIVRFVLGESRAVTVTFTRRR